jgi:hypothetical protein
MARPRRPVPGVDALRATWERDAAQLVRSGGVAAFRSDWLLAATGRLIGVPRGNALLPARFLDRFLGDSAQKDSERSGPEDVDRDELREPIRDLKGL